VSGTSGKSTVTGLVWHILNHAGENPSLLSGAGLVALEEQGKIGNGVAGTGWLVAEADESDGSLVRYAPKIGVLLNIDKDHKELGELKEIFRSFVRNTKAAGGQMIVNASHPVAKEFVEQDSVTFGWERTCSVWGSDWSANGFGQDFVVHFGGEANAAHLPMPGRHNAENALAAIAACLMAGLSLSQCVEALASWKGIYRRHQLVGQRRGVCVMDDYAHNPAKVAASIRSAQDIVGSAGRVLAWFQPHGFGPTRFLRQDFVTEIARALRPCDRIWLSDIYYAGGTVVRDISSQMLVEDLVALGAGAFYFADREECAQDMWAQAREGDCVLLMGARDPSLAAFARTVVGMG
jgi:UDP-N-acetylmuramate--alanine ligase